MSCAAGLPAQGGRADKAETAGGAPRYADAASAGAGADPSRGAEGEDGGAAGDAAGNARGGAGNGNAAGAPEQSRAEDGWEYGEDDREEEDEEAPDEPDMSRRLEARLDSLLASSREPRRSARTGRVYDGFDGDKTVGEVLDRPAVRTLYGMIKSGVVSHVNGPVSAGKESVVFWAGGPDGTDVALKVYLVSTASFKRRAPYILGDPRFGRLRRGTRNMVRLWARKEFANLSACRRCGIAVPMPIRVEGTVLAMSFMGSGGRPYDTLVSSRNVRMGDYREAVELVRRLYTDARLVHADLSPYNIFKTPRMGLYLFDLGSAVDTRHPRASEFLQRDINNMTAFFAKRGLVVDNPADVMAEVTRAQ